MSIEKFYKKSPKNYQRKFIIIIINNTKDCVCVCVCLKVGGSCEW